MEELEPLRKKILHLVGKHPDTNPNELHKILRKSKVLLGDVRYAVLSLINRGKLEFTKNRKLRLVASEEIEVINDMPQDVGKVDMFSVRTDAVLDYGQGVTLTVKVAQGELGDSSIYGNLELNLSPEKAEALAYLLNVAVDLHRRKVDEYGRSLV